MLSYFAPLYRTERETQIKYEKNFRETLVYYYNLINNGTSITDICNMPYPFFYDLVETAKDIKQKEMAEKQKAQNKISKNITANTGKPKL